MPQEVLRQSNFNGGELSPQAVGRRDLKAYASSLALAINMMPMAEGPIRRRPGLRHVDLVRNKLATVPVTEAMLSAPNGGAAGGVLTGAGFETTTPLETAGGYVVLEIDFGAPTTVGMVDLVDFLIKAPSGGGGGGGGDLDPLPDPTPPQYPWNPLSPELIVS
ncbi:hypothetical protein ACFPIF_19425 [Brevundimonas faecalis]|uniref:hypothetical protein n=1 Tax=Brevundimonas faecalis TaxID=947378 RepID=UPI00361DAE8F